MPTTKQSTQINAPDSIGPQAQDLVQEIKQETSTTMVKNNTSSQDPLNIQTSESATTSDTKTPEAKPWFFTELRNTAKEIVAKQYDALKLKAQEKGSELLNQAKDKLSSKANEVGDQASAKLEEAKDNVIKKFKWLV